MPTRSLFCPCAIFIFSFWVILLPNSVPFIKVREDDGSWALRLQGLGYNAAWLIVASKTIMEKVR